MGKIGAATRRTSESLRDDPAGPDPYEIDDATYAAIPPTNTDPAHTEIVLRRKIRKAMKDGHIFAAGQAKHFLDGDGKERRFSRDEARGLYQIRDAEKVNKGRFIKSLLDKPIIAGLWRAGRTGFRDDVLGLGAPVAFDDMWDRDISLLDSGLDLDTEFLVGAGRSKFVSTGNFTAHREGKTIIVTGVVTHTWKDKYDFDKGDWPLGFNRRGWILQQSGRGKVFQFGATWRQRLTVRIEFEDGKPIMRSPKWEELDDPE